jgi:hypothetical protein
MSGILPAAIRTALQSWWGIVAGWLASLGITVSEEQSVLVLGLLTAVGIGLVTAGIRWLETRQGDGWQVWARRLASWLMLGMSGSQPTYNGATTAKR